MSYEIFRLFSPWNSIRRYFAPHCFTGVPKRRAVGRSENLGLQIVIRRRVCFYSCQNRGGGHIFAPIILRIGPPAPQFRRPWPVSEWRRAQFLYSNDALRKHFWGILAWKFSSKCHKRIYQQGVSAIKLYSLITMFLERFPYQLLFFEIQRWTFNWIFTSEIKLLMQKFWKC